MVAYSFREQRRQVIEQNRLEARAKYDPYIQALAKAFHVTDRQVIEKAHDYLFRLGYNGLIAAHHEDAGVAIAWILAYCECVAGDNCDRQCECREKTAWWLSHNSVNGLRPLNYMANKGRLEYLFDNKDQLLSLQVEGEIL